MGIQCFRWTISLLSWIISLFKQMKDDYDHDQPRDMDRPLILRYFGSYYPNFSIIDGESEKECKLPRELKELTPSKFVTTCDELVLIQRTKHPYPCFVYNPLSKGKGKVITIDPPTLRLGFGCHPCGFFFHPLEKEYRILVGGQDSEGIFEYHIYLFGANMWRRTLTPYFQRLPTYNWSKGYVSNANPAIVNRRLHWLVDGIMVFDMISEGFFTKPLCFGEGHPGQSYLMRELLVKDDSLCLCNVGCEIRILDIWILEDYEKWHWNKKYVIRLDWGNIYPVKYDLRRNTILNLLSVLSIQKDELVLHWRLRGIFYYNLALHTVKKIHLRRSEIDVYEFELFRTLYGFVAYKATRSDRERKDEKEVIKM